MSFSARDARGSFWRARRGMEQATATPLPDASEPDVGFWKHDETFAQGVSQAAQRELTLQKESLPRPTSACSSADKEPRCCPPPRKLASAQDAQLFPVYSILVRLSIPLWDGGKTTARSRIAKLGTNSLAARERQHTMTLQRNNRQAIQEELAAEAQHTAALELQQIAEIQLADAQEQESLGGSAFEAVHIAHARLLDARTKVAHAQLAWLRPMAA
ncbi:MAG: TolC family protein [Myxococcota bacterium]